MLGHVNAALELAEQIARGEMPVPARVVLPVGSGGTAAGLALGFAIAGMDIVVVGARVAPRIAAGRMRVLALAGASGAISSGSAASAFRASTGAPRDHSSGVRGRLRSRASRRRGRGVRVAARATGLELDGTYSAKAFAAACALASRTPNRLCSG